MMKDLVAAIVTDLNGHEFSLAFTATRSWRPRFTLEEMNVLHVTVLPRTLSPAPADRSETEKTVEIDVGIQQRYDAETLEGQSEADWLDSLAALAEEVADFCKPPYRPAAYPAAVTMEVAASVAPNPEHLDELRQYTGVVTLTMQVTE
jgi:hypothetical protein